MRLKEQVDAYKNKKKVAKRLKEDLAVKPAQLSGIYRIYIYVKLHLCVYVFVLS